MMGGVSEGDWRRSFRIELLRSIPQGLVDTIALTFAIFIAVRVFEAPAWVKTLVVSAASYGLLVSLFAVPAVRRSRYTANAWIGLFWLLSGIGLLFAALIPQQWAFVLGVGLSSMAMMLGLPLSSQLYRMLYPDAIRGRLFARAAVVRAASAGLAAYAIGHFLRENGAAYPVVLTACGVACFVMVACVLRLPAVHLPAPEGSRPRFLGAFRHVRTDADFRRLLISWMFLGTGNLMCVALFVEYLANPVHGYGFDSEKVGLITIVLPSALFLCTVVLWGYVFDRWNFYLVRSVLNLFFAAGLAIYFLIDAEWALWTGLAIHGFARGGANVAWSLWTTKFATKDLVADYMSVHTFLTGVRGSLAPVIAFTVIEAYSPQTVAIIGVSLVLMATAIIAPKVQWRD